MGTASMNRSLTVNVHGCLTLNLQLLLQRSDTSHGTVAATNLITNDAKHNVLAPQTTSFNG
jgi:hypothetical protein